MTFRFYTPPPLPELQQEFTLSDSIFHHAINVLRLRVGDELVLFDGINHAATAHISRIDKKSAQATITQSVTQDAESNLNITLAQCLSSSDKMDWTIEKAVELGVNRIVPLFSAKSQIKLTPERAAKKIEHWQRIIIAACAQCGRNTLPSIETPQSIQTFLKQPTDAYQLMLHPIAAIPLKALVKPEHITQFILLIGPEAGFSNAEIAAAQTAGYTTTVLGSRILRTESAGLAAIAALQTLWGDF